MIKNQLVIAVSIIAVFLVSCQKNKENDSNRIKVGVESGPEYVVAQTAQKVAKERYGLEVELVEFNDYVLPNTALNDGDIDVNAIQHKPFLEDQMKQRGYKLAVVGNTFIYPLAGYSKKIKSVQELQEGNTIAIPNDATNGGRALLLLQKQGLIKLKDTLSLLPKVVDITDNPKKIKIIELEAPQLPRVLDDREVTIAIINNTFAAKAGLTLEAGLFVEDKDSPYVNVIVAREDNKNAENVKKFVQAYQSEEVAQAADREFKGGAIKGW
ncbi:MAG: methionine ABC transporter substrate-binding lipoprotein MetQ [Flavobacteriaceae bacterium]|jgi:D-methionine transport system substrate-binding protein|nr:methionine ABC transporter substrate-binding lipoprotein MetQ [Flavobacteriaceae bacterium]